MVVYFLDFVTEFVIELKEWVWGVCISFCNTTKGRDIRRGSGYFFEELKNP